MNELLINSFEGTYSFLSNFHYAPISCMGHTWPTSEHLFQALKTKSGEEQLFVLYNYDGHGNIIGTCTPGQAKRRGRKVNLRSDWEQVKEAIMRWAVKLKFEQHPGLMKRLQDTGNALLVEGNHWHDNTWGNCNCQKCKHIPGKNMLGKILMDQRSL